MNCLDCGGSMDCLNIKNEADPAFFNGPASDWRRAWVCSECTPETYRRFKNT